MTDARMPGRRCISPPIALRVAALCLFAVPTSFAQDVQQATRLQPAGEGGRAGTFANDWQSTHPFADVVRYAEGRREHLAAAVRDYQCLLVKRERLAGHLQPHEYVELKVRHSRTEDNGRAIPFAVYLKYLGPSSIKGREVLYVEGENNGQLIATKGGGGPLANVTLTLDPHSDRALQSSLYPITEIGILNLAERLVVEGREQIRADDRPDEWDIQHFEKAKIADRVCHCIQLRRTRRLAEDSLHTMRVFIDEQHAAPVRYAMYHWPVEEGGAPVLMQEYTYTNLQWNVGLGDSDFARNNPDYRFYTSSDTRSATTAATSD
ncbi:MAG: DUF1571 domain-containing protein [Planctomycetales bacterium]|nr:DUF1571 domain-containing protein [Planctomycetales bacterium]